MQPIIVTIQTDPRTLADRVQQWLDEQSQAQRDSLTARSDFMSSWFYRYAVSDQWLEADPPEIEIYAISVRIWREVRELSRMPYRYSTLFPEEEREQFSIARILFFGKGRTELHLPQWQECGIERESLLVVITTQLETVEQAKDVQSSVMPSGSIQLAVAPSGGEAEDSSIIVSGIEEAIHLILDDEKACAAGNKIKYDDYSNAKRIAFVALYYIRKKNEGPRYTVPRHCMKIGIPDGSFKGWQNKFKDEANRFLGN